MPDHTHSTPSPRGERLLVALVLALLVWLPLPLGSNRDWAVGLFIGSVGALALPWSLLQLRRPQSLRPTSARQASLPLIAALLLTQAWVATQWLGGLSADVGATFQSLMLGLAYTVLFTLVIGLFHTRSRLTLLLSVLVISGTFQAFFGAFMTLSGIEWLLTTPKTSYVGDATGTFINRNHLAGYLELTLACGIGLLLALRDDKPFRWVHVLELIMSPKARLRLALVIMVIALVMSHSRGGNAGFFIGLLAAGSLFVLRNRTHRTRNILILLSIVLIDMLVISQYFGLERLKERVLNTRLTDVVVDGEVVQTANELRDDVVLQALPLLRERPLTGQGAGSFEAVFQQYPDATIPLHFDHAHNDYLQFIIEFGLLGTLPLLAFCGLALWHALRGLWRRESTFTSGVGFGAVMGIITLAVHSISDFNLQIPANAATFVVLCAIAVLSSQHDTRRRRGSGRPRVAAASPGHS